LLPEQFIPTIHWTQELQSIFRTSQCKSTYSMMDLNQSDLIAQLLLSLPILRINPWNYSNHIPTYYPDISRIPIAHQFITDMITETYIDIFDIHRIGQKRLTLIVWNSKGLSGLKCHSSSNTEHPIPKLPLILLYHPEKPSRHPWKYAFPHI